MNILIAGDSWGCGEWNVECSAINHKGLEQYLLEDNHQVFNLSKGGSSNLDSINRIRLWFDRFVDVKIDIIIAFQTEFTRDFKHDVIQQEYNKINNDWENIKKITDISSRWVERFYFRLSEIAQEKKCSVLLIGGASDTLWFDNMQIDYPGCTIACQSITNLLLHGSHKIDNPILSWYTNKSFDFIKKIKLAGIHQGEIMSAIDLGMERESSLKENPNLFFPDGIHPNRIGHRILFDFLKKEKYIQ